VPPGRPRDELRKAGAHLDPSTLPPSQQVALEPPDRCRVGVGLVRPATGREAASEPSAQARALVDRNPGTARAQPEGIAQRLERRLGGAPGGERAGIQRAIGPWPVAQREHGQRVRDAEPEVAPALGTRAAGVRGRAPGADQLELDECRLELAAERHGVDPRERSERGLQCRLLPARAEVRAHALLQVARLADVERPPVLVAQDVDARSGRHLRRVAPSRLRRTWSREPEIERILDRPRATLLRDPEQHEQELTRRLRIGQRAVDGTRRKREAVGQRVQIAAQPATGQQPPRERDRVEHRQLEPSSVDRAERALQEADVEARVVRDEHAALREPQQVAQGRPDGPGAL
jgi:hypothetical protein